MTKKEENSYKVSLLKLEKEKERKKKEEAGREKNVCVWEKIEQKYRFSIKKNIGIEKNRKKEKEPLNQTKKKLNY